MTPTPATAPVRTTCPYCGVGCGVLVGRGTDAPLVTIAGDPEHPANHGRLCSKGSALGETLSLDGRLLTPRLRGGGQPGGAPFWRDVTWNEALDTVADGFKRVIAEHGRDAVAFYVSGQLLTEDYYVANKFMKGYIGTANIDTNSRLCMSSAVAAHKRAFGEDIVPVSYDDLEAADLVVLVGSNTAWCHPVVYQRLVRAKQLRPQLKVVVIDPRATATCDLADLHLPVASGTDVWLFNGLLSYLHAHATVDLPFISAHTKDAGRALTVADNTAGSVAAVARRCGLQGAALEEFYQLFARTPRVVTLFSQGVNQSTSGTDKANAIINCHLLTGRIGKPGAGPFSITGQPNAMGGREVGGMANMLAAHRDLDDADDRRAVQQFWGSPTIADRPGLKAVELFDAIHAGTVKAVWIAGTNPVVSLPNADKVKDALRRCELVVVSDCNAHTDTTALAHVLLPAAAWGEKDGTVTNSERCISRQRKFLESPGDAKPDWWMFAEVARRLGFGAGFAYESAHDIFVEHAALSAHANAGRRAFDIGALAALTAEQYDALAPVRWPVPVAAHDPPRLFADGRFYHANGRARFVPTPPRSPMYARDEEFPWVLNTGRIRDQWHTMTRTGKSARLMAHTPEPFVDMHPQDALLAGVRVGEFVRVVTHWGSMVARLRLSGELPRRMIFVPMHWSDVWSADARVGALVNPSVDPVSGEPELKHTPARVEAFIVAWQGFLLTRTPPVLTDATWWSISRGETFFHYEMAGRRVFRDWSPWARRMTAATPEADWLEYVDRATGIYRAAYLVDNRLEACLFLSPRPDLPKRSWVSSLFAKQSLGDADRAGLLMGQPADAAADAGPVVCSCFGVGRNVICKAIRSGGLTSTDEIGRRLRAGTNCGSCLPELRALLSEESEAEAVSA
jgi:assimilatory nitrate reductase catalytic subunit